jgi:hypothetical protein
VLTYNQVEWSKLCLFVAGPPLYDTVISIHTRWEAFNTPPRFGEAGEESKEVSVTPTGGCHHHRHVFDAIVNQLKVEYSQLRQGNSKQLLYRMLDEVSRTTNNSQCCLDRSNGLCMYWGLSWSKQRLVHVLGSRQFKEHFQPSTDIYRSQSTFIPDARDGVSCVLTSLSV